MEELQKNLLSAGVKITGPPKMAAFSPKARPVLRIVNNSAMKKEQLRRKLKLQRERKLATDKAIKEWRQEVLLEMYRENPFTLLEDEPSDDVIYFVPKRRKFKLKHKFKIPKIAITPPDSEPAYDFDYPEPEYSDDEPLPEPLEPERQWTEQRTFSSHHYRIVIDDVEKEDEEYWTRPLTNEQTARIIYGYQSDFFKTYFDTYIEKHGIGYLTQTLEKYLWRSKQTGTPEYFIDHLFRTRKWRDDLVNFLDRHLLKVDSEEMVSQGYGAQPSEHSGTWEEARERWNNEQYNLFIQGKKFRLWKKRFERQRPKDIPFERTEITPEEAQELQKSVKGIFADCVDSQEDKMVSQGLESYTTTRDSHEEVVDITAGNNVKEIAPNTISENAMDLQTVLRRYYPLVVSHDVDNTMGFTVIAWPVNPAFVPPPAQISSPAFTSVLPCNNLAWWLRLFAYWRGSMRGKLLVDAEDADVYIWHEPLNAHEWTVTSGVTEELVQERMSFAGIAGVTKTQNGYEFEIPFYSPYNQLLVDSQHKRFDLRTQNGTCFIAIRNPKLTKFHFSLFVSTGEDFLVNVLKAPPNVFEPQIYANTDVKTSYATFLYPDLSRSVSDKSLGTQLPGDPAMHNITGYFNSCDPVTLPKINQMRSQMDGNNTDNLESASVTQSTANITFVDERPLDTAQVHTTSDLSTKDPNFDMAEDQWYIKKILEREYPVGKFSWGVAADLTTDLARMPLPKTLLDQLSSPQRQQLLMFAFLRTGIKVRVQLNTTKFHQGRIICYYVPPLWKEDDEKELYDEKNRVNWPHFIIDASVGNSGILEIPFIHFMTHFSQQKGTLASPSNNTLGQFIVQPLNKLQAAEGASTSLSGVIYMAFMNPEVHQLTNPTDFDYGDGYVQGLEGVLKNAAGSLINSGLGIADKFTGGLVTGAGDALSSLLGLGDKPTDPIASTPIINRSIDALAHGAGLDRSIRLGLSPTALSNVDPGMVGTAQSTDFNLKTLAQIPTLLMRTNWTSSHESGHKFDDLILCPTFLSDSRYIDGKTYAQYNPTMLAYVSRPNCLWRGDLMVKIQVIASQFHSGRLFIVYDPQGTTNYNNITLDLNQTKNAIIMDIEEKQELTIRIPYMATRPWLRCDRFRCSGNLQPSVNVKERTCLNEASMGILRIFVMNTLVRPENVANNVDINIFFYAGSNFELAIPNSISPLDVAKPVNTNRVVPRFPWCSKEGDKLCPDGAYIQQVYDDGKRLIEKGYLRPVGDRWWFADVPTGVRITDETKVWIDKAKKLKAYTLDPIPGPCANYMQSLPSYTSVEDKEDTLQEVLTTTKEIKSTTNQISSTTASTWQTLGIVKGLADQQSNRMVQLQRKVDETSNALVPKMNDTYANTVTTIQKCNDILINCAKGTEQMDSQMFDVNVALPSNMVDTVVQQLVERPEFATITKDITRITAHTVKMTESASTITGLTKGLITGAAVIALVQNIREMAREGLNIARFTTFVVLLGAIFHLQHHLLQQVIQHVWDSLSECTRQEVNHGATSQGQVEDFLDEKRRIIVPAVATFCTLLYASIFGKVPVFSQIKEKISAWLESDEEAEKSIKIRSKKGKRNKQDDQGMTSQALLDDLRGLHFATLGITALERVFTKLSSLAESCIDWWLGDECPSARAERVLKGTNDKILKWLKEIEDLNDDESLHLALSDVMYHNRFYQLMDDANDFLKYCVENKVPPAIFTIVKEGRKQSQDLLKRLSDIRPQHGFRYAPFIVCLNGPSGTGKSNMMHRIRRIIQANLGAPRYNLVHAMATGEEQFLSGYEGQTIIEWDDAAQNSKQDSLLAQFINWASNADVRLNMPDLPHKGMFFQSKAIIQSTNVAYVKINNIREMEAYLRRRHMVIQCEFRPGWDQERVEALDEPDTEFSFARFKLRNPKKEDEDLTGWLSFDRIMNRVNRRHIKHHQKQLKLIQSYMELEGSMQIPKGVQPVELTPEQIAELDAEEERERNAWNEVRLVEEGANSSDEDDDTDDDDMVHQMDSQMMDECDEADLFEDAQETTADPTSAEYAEQLSEKITNYLWQTMTDVRKQRVWRMFHRRMEMLKPVKRDVSIIGKFKQYLTDFWASVKKKAKEFYDAFPMFATVLGIVGSLAVAIPIVSYLFVKQGQSESAYETNPKVVTRLTRAEIDNAEKITRSESAYESGPIARSARIVRAEGSYETGPTARIPKIMRAEGLELNENDLDLIRQRAEIISDYDVEAQTDLYAICIPSGEGKTTLCKKYPDIFVDADEKIMFGNVVRPKTAIIGALACLGMAFGHSPWSKFANFYKRHQPESKKILLTHHPSFTDRKILGSFMLPHPTNIRANLMGRGALAEVDPHIMTYDERDEKIFSLIKDLNTGPMKSEGTNDETAVNLARQKIHPILSCVAWLEDQTLTARLQCAYIGGKVLLIPHHFFRGRKEGDTFCLVRGSNRIIVEYVPERAIRIKDKDAVLYYAGARLPSRKSLLKYFVSEKDIGKIPVVESLLVGVTMDGIETEKAVEARGNTTQHYDDDAYVQYGWSYKAHTISGECGSLLVGCSPQLPSPAKIIGMHTAGFTKKIGGFSVLLTQEMILEAITFLENRFGKNVLGLPIPPEVMRSQEAVDKLRVIPEGNFAIYGAMPNKLAPAQPQKTSLRPTPFQGEIAELKKKPAALTPINGISPLKNALKKYGKITLPFCARDIEVIKTDMISELRNKLKTRFGKRIATEEEAIFGIDGLDYVDKMNMKTSAGWPYQCLNPTQHGKAYLFDLTEKRIKDHELRTRLDARLEAARKGERVPSIWRDCLKDELRPIEKVEQGKTRLFTIAPVDFTILVRRYFLAFEEAFYANNSTFFSAVGINPESFEWTAMWNYLREYGEGCFAGDFESYDGTLMAELMKAACDVINGWYIDGPENALIRETLIDEMIHTVQLVNNTVYGTFQGNPSGNPLTVIINTMVNVMYMRLAWRSLAPVHLRAMYHYHQNVREMAYGDDNIIMVKKDAQEFFNQVTVSGFLKGHGIGYTDESKTNNLVTIRPLNSVTFLKRGFRTDPEFGSNIVLPTMSVDTITSLCDWYRAAPDVNEQIRTNILCALSFAFYHGKTFYEDFKSKCDAALERNDIETVSIQYEEWLELFQATMTGTVKTTSILDYV